MTARFCFNQEILIYTEALIALFSILFIFWPAIPLFGVRSLFLNELPFIERCRVGIRRVFYAWLIWGIFLSYIYWHGRQPIIFLPENINHILFFCLGILTGGISIGWGVSRWRGRRVRLSDARKIEDLLALSPKAFEAFIAELFRTYGYQAEVSGGNSDHGVDIVVHNSQGDKWIVQCKRYSGSVGEPIVRDLFGTMRHEGAQRAYLITTGSFTLQAVDWAKGKPIVLYDGEALVSLIRRTQKRMSRLG